MNNPKRSGISRCARDPGPSVFEEESMSGGHWLARGQEVRWQRLRLVRDYSLRSSSLSETAPANEKTNLLRRLMVVFMQKSLPCKHEGFFA